MKINSALELRKSLQMKVQKEMLQQRDKPSSRKDYKSGASLEGDGVKYFLPDNYPSDRDMTMSRLYQLGEGDSTEVILLDTWVTSPGHRVNNFTDVNVLPERLRGRPKNVQYMKFACTSKEPDFATETKVSDAWESIQDEGETFLTLGDEELFVLISLNSDNKFVLEFAESAHARPADFEPFDDEDTAKLVGQAVYKSLTSCGFCEDSTRFYMKPRIERDGAKSNSWKLGPEASICMYVLGWSLLHKPEGAKYGRVAYKDARGVAIPFDFHPDPAKNEPAIRKGMFHIDAPMTASNKSSRYRTMENYMNYRTQVSRMCGCCMEKVEVRTARELNSGIIPMLVVDDILDPVSGMSLLGSELPDADKFASENDLVAASEQLFRHADLTAMLEFTSEDDLMKELPPEAQGRVIVDDGAVWVLPVLKLTCSNPECKTPRRTRVSEVVTVLTHETGGFYSFRLGVPEDKKMHRAWDLTHADTFGQLSVQDSLGKFGDVLNHGDAAAVFKYPEHFEAIELSPEDVKRFL